MNFNPRAPRGARRLLELHPGQIQVISIHVPREGHDPGASLPLPAARTFQSTCPARGTTSPSSCSLRASCNFNPRAPRGARRNYLERLCEIIVFQSTCPARGTTDVYQAIHAIQEISIHVPREGHDASGTPSGPDPGYFNPRAPRGARHLWPRQAVEEFLFQSTCPARGTTVVQIRDNDADSISIHVPREGHDTPSATWSWECGHFNPRAPRGARL